MAKENEDFREEVRKEFQLDRMILFSDAVFAIVVTLMAIEIRLPESADEAVDLPQALLHLLPTFIAYLTSFAFVGVIWYQHLRVFGVLKDYDGGLVVRNLILLCMVGLFPFGISVLTHAKSSGPGFAVYASIIFACLIAQYALQHYILVKRPGLCIRGDHTGQLQDLHRRKVALLSAGVGMTLILLTLFLSSDPAVRAFALWWMFLVPISMRLFARKKAGARAKAAAK